jgi:hypothetical protein
VFRLKTVVNRLLDCRLLVIGCWTARHNLSPLLTSPYHKERNKEKNGMTEKGKAQGTPVKQAKCLTG